jgi:hypothetical protein
MIDNPYNELNDHTFLIYLAQNDYMIDGHFLPEGKRLMEIANKLNEKAMFIFGDGKSEPIIDFKAEKYKKSQEEMDRLSQLDEELGLND